MSKNIEGKAVSRPTSSRAVAFAMSQPDDMDVNGILYQPMRQEL